MSFDSLVQQINELAETQRDRGTYFEYLARAYFQNEPTYQNEFKNIWMLADVPEEYGIPKTDIGVDLVAETFTGELVAIQAKFYDRAIQKSNIDSFLSELGKNYYKSGIIVASTDKWGKNAEKALADRSDIVRIGLSDLRNSRIDWDKFSFERPDEVTVKAKKKPRYYQKEVIEKALTYFKENDRGQLIMAPGTGKTFTSLKVAEAMAKESDKEQYVVLYLVPSIQLLTQTLRGWNNDTDMTMSSMAVTSDRNASRSSVKQDKSNIQVKASDIGYPATTSPEKVLSNYRELMAKPKKELLVVFGTYQSIDVLGKAQKEGFPEFDLIIADEAHRTTGAKALGEEDSSFTKVHSNSNVKGYKRLYQTATPKLYGTEARKKAESNSILVSSMDDENLYGKVFYRLGFGDAISHDILTDYKLMVLAVDETIVQKDMQKSLSDPENGLNIDDVGRIIGVWNGMIKRESFTDKVSGEPMKRAIAFSRTIKDSQRLSEQFENVVNDYLDSDKGYSVNVRHVDGSMNALQKNEALDWLASDDIPEDSARILSNVRFLTEGIVLTDTFESTETEDTLDDSFFGTNDKRLKRQQEKPITAIIGNPPYSIGQNSQNDNNQNISYPRLDKRLAETYVSKSNAGLTKGLYDSYVKAFRWASDRLTNQGVIGFVTNGGYLNSNSTDGLRAGLYEDFNHLYIFNLRGNALGLGEIRKKEGGNVFGAGTRTSVAISILVKDGSDNHELHYHDIGDYLSRKEKLAIISEFGDVSQLDWGKIIPDENNDWLNQRDPNYQKYDRLAGEDKVVFLQNIIGVSTNRDSWVYGFSEQETLANSKRLIENYNFEVVRLSDVSIAEKKDCLNRKDDFIKWSAKLEDSILKSKKIQFNKNSVVKSLYRPFTKKYLYYDTDVIERPSQWYKKFGENNLIIMTTGKGISRDFSTLVTNLMPNLHTMDTGQHFMRYDNELDETSLFQNNDNMNQTFADKLGLSLDETFAYVYGLLNSREYQEKYANDLKKDLARIPIVKNKEKYVEVGQKLMDLHLNYEEVPVYEGVEITPFVNPNYKVTKMRFAKKRDENGRLVSDLSAIIFNSDITISNIPEKAYEYVVNGRSAIEWIIDQYQIKTDKKSGITDDPNDYSDDEKYIFNLLLRIINVSIQTVDLINSLPKLEIDE